MRKNEEYVVRGVITLCFVEVIWAFGFRHDAFSAIPAGVLILLSLVWLRLRLPDPTGPLYRSPNYLNVSILILSRLLSIECILLILARVTGG